MAMDSYVESVKSFPYSAALALRMDFTTSAGMKQLGGIVDRLTYLGACDLLLGPDEVSLKAHLMSADLKPGITGGLLERQLDVLEPHLWKEGVRNIVKALLAHALEVYHGEMPVRRARVLVRCLEFMYRSGPESVRALGWNPEEMGSEIEKLNDRKVRNYPLSPDFFPFLILIVPC
jgi:separase